MAFPQPLNWSVLGTGRAELPFRLVPISCYADFEAAFNPRTDLVALDTETTGLDSKSGWPLGFSVAWRDREGRVSAGYVPVDHPVTLFEQNVPRADVERILAAVWGWDGTFCYHNAPFDVRFFRKLAPYWSLERGLIDTLAMFRVLGKEANTGERLSLGLLDLFANEFPDDEVFIGRQKAIKGRRGGLSAMALADVAEYGAADAFMTLVLSENMQDYLKKHELDRMLWDRECRFEKLLQRVEDTGIPVDPTYIAQLERRFEEQALDMVAELRSLGLTRPGSPLEEAKWLYDVLGLQPGVLTDTGHRSVSSDALAPHVAGHREVGLLMDWRQLVKARSSWLTPIKNWSAASGRIHGEWNVAGTVSGRISCSNPNLQALPLSDRGALTYGSLSGIFKGAPGWNLWSADYKQADLRLATAIAKEEAMAQVFASGKDPYMEMAALAFGERSPAKRQLAKRLSLATINAVGPRTAAGRFEISLQEAEKALEGHRNAFPMFVRAGRWFERRVTTEGSITLWNGRALHLGPGDEAHKAFSRVVQGGVAEMVKEAMLQIDQFLKQKSLKARMVAQVHDSIVLEIPLNEEAAVLPEVERIMEEALPPSIRSRTDPPVKMEVEVSLWQK